VAGAVATFLAGVTPVMHGVPAIGADEP